MLLAVGLGRLLAGRWEAKQAALISRDETTGGKTKDITTVKIHSGHEALLGLNINKDVKETAGDTAAAAEPQAPDQVPTEIFRAYDIRGLVEEQINKELAYKIGQALGSEALDAGQGTLVVAKDARTHSPCWRNILFAALSAPAVKPST